MLVWIASVAYAAQPINLQPDFSNVTLGFIFNGVAFIGTLIWLQKKYIYKVDQVSETTPAILETLKTIKESLEAHTKSIEVHYKTLEEHGNSLTTIDTIHKMRGCDTNISRESK